MKAIRLLACTIACVLMAAGIARAQGVGSSGAITGTVVDPSGGVIPKVVIVAEETTRGIKYTAVSEASGQFRLTGMPPAIYTLTARLPGFETVVMKGVIVYLGETTNVDFHLTLASTAAQVEVTAEAPVVETERGSQANTLNEQYIGDLPIDRRDYLTFTLLMPGVADSTRLADDQDFRVKQTPQSGLSFYGSNGRGNSVTVDGGEAQDDAGGVRLTLSQDAVEEFQVNRSNYGADLGGASGASINIVTKSGSNDIHGNLFSFFRNDALDARDPFAFSSALAPGATFNTSAEGSPIKNSLQRYQYGANIGLPIRKDKTFLYAAFEGLDQDAQNAVPLLTNANIFLPTAAQQSVISTTAGARSTPVPCLSGPVGTVVAGNIGAPPPPPNGATYLPGAECAAVLSTVLSVNPAANALDAFLVNQLESNGGVFPYTTHEYLASFRLDHRISASDQIFFTYRYAHDLEENPDVQSLTGYSAGSSIHTYDNNLEAAWFHQFSNRSTNEFRVQFNYDSTNVIPNEPAEVGLQIFGFANNLGTNVFIPNFSILRRPEIADNVTMIRGTHTMTFGVSELLRNDHDESHTFMPGRFVFGTLPGDLLSPLITSISSLQSASFGLPEIYQQGFGNPDYAHYTRPLTGLYWQDSWKIANNFTLNYGVRYEIDSQFLPLNTYYGDVGPRLSFAWDPFKDHKTVIRGGYGIFYGPIDAQIPQVDLSLGVLNKDHSTVENQHNTAQVPEQVDNLVTTCGIANSVATIFPGTGASPCNRYISIYVDTINPTGLPGLQTAPVVFGTLFAEGLIGCTKPTPGNLACITPASVAPLLGGLPVNSGPVAPLSAVFSNPPNYKPPYSQQASVGIEREITPGFSIALSGIYSHTLRLPVAIDTNLEASPQMVSTIELANGKTVSYHNWNMSSLTDPYVIAGVSLETSGPGSASALGKYYCATTFNNLLQPISPCFVNPLISQNNQYTSAASALYEGGIIEVKKRFSDHFTLFGNYTYSKAFDTTTDFNSDYGPQDPTDLGADRGLSEFDERHKVVIAGLFDSPWKNSVLGGFQLAPIFTYHSGHPFNLLAGGEVNGDNHTTNERPVGAPRDSGLGPNLIDFDMRLSWEHKLGERLTLKLTAEAFNLFDRTNYASVNNEVGPYFGLTTGVNCPVAGLCPIGNTTFSVHGIKPGTMLPDGTLSTPSTPLDFTSALPMREFQLGIRFTY